MQGLFLCENQPRGFRPEQLPAWSKSFPSGPDSREEGSKAWLKRVKEPKSRPRPKKSTKGYTAIVSHEHRSAHSPELWFKAMANRTFLGWGLCLHPSTPSPPSHTALLDALETTFNYTPKQQLYLLQEQAMPTQMFQPEMCQLKNIFFSFISRCKDFTEMIRIGYKLMKGEG